MQQADRVEKQDRLKVSDLNLDFLQKDQYSLEKEGDALKSSKHDIIPLLEVGNSSPIPLVSPRCRVSPGSSLGQLLPRVKRMKSPRRRSRNRSFGSPRTGGTDTSETDYSLEVSEPSDYEK